MSKYAFPRAQNGFQSPTTGITLRQWYAGQALSGLCASRAYTGFRPKTLASMALDQADAVIATEEEEKK